MEAPLKTKRKYPWTMMASVYITQYIGLAFIMSATVVILRQQGMALDKLALLNLAALPLMGKVFYAPLIDKYRFLLRGKYRSWLILAQALMTIFLAIAGSMDFEQQFTGVLVVLALYVFSMSIQDVAIDGLSCKLADAKTRKVASSIQFSGNLLGNIIGGGLILMFYPWLEWQGSLWLLAAITCISFIQIIFFVEPQDASDESSRFNGQHHLLRDIKDFIQQHKNWFFILALYPIGSTCGFALLNPLLVDSGWPLDEIGFVMKIFGSAVGLISALLAAPLISRIGREKALVTAIFIQAFSLLLILPLTFGFTVKPMVYGAIAVHFISFPALLVISSTMMMDKAADTLNKATFFTLQFSFASFFGFVYSMISMTIANHIGYSPVVIVGSIITFIIAILTWFVLKQMTEKKQFSSHLAVNI